MLAESNLSTVRGVNRRENRYELIYGSVKNYPGRHSIKMNVFKFFKGDYSTPWYTYPLTFNLLNLNTLLCSKHGWPKTIDLAQSS